MECWAFNICSWTPSPEEWKRLVGLVQPEERERIGRFRFEDDRKRALAGRLMIRKCVAKFLNVLPTEVVLKRTDMNKPYVSSPNPGDFNFNLSHHGKWVVIVAHPSRPIGVDVMEYEDPRGSSVKDFFSTMRQQFTNEEWVQILGNGGEQKNLEMFYRFWSLKESYIKTIGIGLGFELQRATFTFNKETNRAELKVDGKLESNFDFVVQALDDEHCVATAENSEPSKSSLPGTWETLTADQLG